MTSALVYSWHVHFSSAFLEQQWAACDQVQGAGYSESEVETDTTDLEMENLVVPQEVSKQEQSM
jgi:hypothetical protein